MRRYFSLNNASRWFKWSRLWDVLAIAVIGFVVWKLLIAPRTLSAANAYPAPHATYARLDGGAFHLAQARGKVLFLDFYASWCEPCRISLPLVERYAHAHPEIQVLPVDVGEPRTVARDFAVRMHLGNVALDPSGLSRGFFQLEGFPTMVVIDPQGRIRATWSGLNPAIGLAMNHAERSL